MGKVYEYWTSGFFCSIFFCLILYPSLLQYPCLIFIRYIRYCISPLSRISICLYLQQHISFEFDISYIKSRINSFVHPLNGYIEYSSVIIDCCATNLYVLCLEKCIALVNEILVEFERQIFTIRCVQLSEHIHLSFLFIFLSLYLHLHKSTQKALSLHISNWIMSLRSQLDIHCKSRECVYIYIYIWRSACKDTWISTTSIFSNQSLQVPALHFVKGP